jgi:hypothetical protein
VFSGEGGRSRISEVYLDLALEWRAANWNMFSSNITS